MIGLMLSLLVAFAIGWLTVRLVWPRGGDSRKRLVVLRMSLAFGLGQGITACLAFLYLLANGSANSSYRFLELLVLAGLFVLFLVMARKNAARETAPASLRPRRRASGATVMLAIAFYATAGAALALVAIRLWDAPHGTYDAWAIWNLRARVLFLAGDEWRDSVPVVGLHPDYPLLLSLSVMRAWVYIGNQTTVAPAALAWLFAAAIIGVVTSGVSALCGRTQGYIAGIALLGYIYFVQHAASQYAEIPLMFFYVAALVMIGLHNDPSGVKSRSTLVLAGLAAGFAAWTKNEGLLFLAAAAVAHFAVVTHTMSLRVYLRQALALGAGLLPVLVIIAYFKLHLAPPNTWVAGMAAPQVVGQVTDAGRYLIIAKELARRFFFYNGVGINMIYLLLLFVVCFGTTRRHLPTVAQAAITLVLMLGGFLGIYLMRNADVELFLRGSLDRVLLQMWPMFVFAFFLFAAPADFRRSDSRRRREGRNALE